MQRLRLVSIVLASVLIVGGVGSAMAQKAVGKVEPTATEVEKKSAAVGPIVVLETSMGEIQLELYPGEAPETVDNFLTYVRDGFYDGTIFHRVIANFMIQGGGFTADMQRKTTRDAIKNEAGNGLKNDRGTIAMARTSAIHSATSQFFINVVDNAFLNHKDETSKGFGYCVFGKVIEGMDVVDMIKEVKTMVKARQRNVPVEVVTIDHAYVVGEQEKTGVTPARETDAKAKPKATSSHVVKETNKVEPRK